MNGNNFLIDTNISLYLLSKDDTLEALLEGKDLYISFITELELLGYKNITKEEQIKVERFVSDCIVIDFNSTIKKTL